MIWEASDFTLKKSSDGEWTCDDDSGRCVFLFFSQTFIGHPKKTTWDDIDQEQPKKKRRKEKKKGKKAVPGAGFSGGMHRKAR